MHLYRLIQAIYMYLKIISVMKSCDQKYTLCPFYHFKMESTVESELIPAFYFYNFSIAFDNTCRGTHTCSHVCDCDAWCLPRVHYTGQ